MKPTVAVGFVHPAGSIAPQFRRSWHHLHLTDALTTKRIGWEFDQESSANISAARNTIVEQFLSTPAEWLWMVDADMTFPPTILEELLGSADPKTTPIVGGLCFGVRPKGDLNDTLGFEPELFPTIYIVGEDGLLHETDGYPENSLVQAHSTGAACLLVHRGVFEHEGWRDGHPFPWFRESVLDGKPCSEDQFFCLKAGGLGFPVHINTAAKTGHVKTFIADESFYRR